MKRKEYLYLPVLTDEALDSDASDVEAFRKGFDVSHLKALPGKELTLYPVRSLDVQERRRVLAYQAGLADSGAPDAEVGLATYFRCFELACGSLDVDDGIALCLGQYVYLMTEGLGKARVGKS